MTEASGRRRADSASAGLSRLWKRQPKGGKRAARPDGPPAPAFIEYDVPGTSPEEVAVRRTDLREVADLIAAEEAAAAQAQHPDLGLADLAAADLSSAHLEGETPEPAATTARPEGIGGPDTTETPIVDIAATNASKPGDPEPDETPEGPETPEAPAAPETSQAPAPDPVEPKPDPKPEPAPDPEPAPEHHDFDLPEPKLDPIPTPVPAMLEREPEPLTFAIDEAPTGEMPAVRWEPRRAPDPKPKAEPVPVQRGPRIAPALELALFGGAVALGGLLLILGNGLEMGPRWLGGVGSLIVTIAYVWVLVSRVGGRAVVGCAVTAVAGVITLIVDRPELNTGAAAVMATVAAVLGVVITVPARRVIDAIREAVIAIVVAGAGAVAALGWRPEIDLARFEYVVLLLGLGVAFTLVYQLGAGLHGLGRRGIISVIFGAVVLFVTLMYAEALKHWTDFALTEGMLDLIGWSRDTIGAFPRPIEALLGVPALVWGTYMRARRRQGWWVCAFGVGGTAAVAVSLMNPEIGVIEVVLSVVYGLVVGIAIGYVLIRIDRALTGGGRRGRRLSAADVRPEPKRTGALL